MVQRREEEEAAHCYRMCACNGAAFEGCHNCNKFFSTVASMLVLLGLSRRNFTKCGLDGCIDRRARSLVTFVPAYSAAALSLLSG